MKILVMTPISPVLSGIAYRSILNKFNDKKEQKGVLCFPFFADIRSHNAQQSYLPTYFAMIKAALGKDMQRKLFDQKNTIVIGNVYKEQEFDVIVALKENDDDEPFDHYIEELKKDPELQNFKEAIKLDELYSLEDAEVVLPTINHLLLFLEGVLKKDEKIKSK